MQVNHRVKVLATLALVERIPEPVSRRTVGVRTCEPPRVVGGWPTSDGRRSSAQEAFPGAVWPLLYRVRRSADAAPPPSRDDHVAARRDGTSSRRGIAAEGGS
jgi:hypothetical protein